MFQQFSEYWQPTLHWQPTTDQDQQFQQLFDLVLEANKFQNLTRLTTPEGFWEKHLWDSLRGILPIWQQENLQVIDIGSGAGFPGFPVAIAKPSWKLTLLDSRIKKTEFLGSVVNTMSLDNVRSLTGRAEQLNSTPACYQHYDLALLRAVGNVDDCMSYALPFIKKGGSIVLYRGQWRQSEVDKLIEDYKSLEVTQIDRFHTPITAGTRHCIYMRLPVSSSP